MNEQHEMDQPGARRKRKKKASAKSFDDQVKQQLVKKVEVREGDKNLEITQQEAMVKSILAQAIKGKPKALNTVVEFLLRERDQTKQKSPWEKSAEEEARGKRRLDRWGKILGARPAVKSAVRRVLGEHGVEDDAINDLFGIKGISEAEEQLRREQALRVIRASGAPAGLLAVITDMEGLHDYFVRTGVVTESDGGQK